MKFLSNSYVTSFLLAAGSLLFTQCEKTDANDGPSSGAENAMPSDVKPTCTVSPTDFAGWFGSGVVTEDGWVKPANSLADLETNGDFYKWSWQMFLWQTSPNGSGLVFNTPPFFDLDAEGNLTSNDESSTNSMKRLSGVKHSLSASASNAEDVDGTGQAGFLTGVLMTQDMGITPDGSLVYYAIHVNDVYAYMASGINSGGITDLKEFPTSRPQLQIIKDYAKSTYDVTLEDSESLTMELKSSWVIADTGIDLSNYLTIQADVPKYVKTSDEKWTWDGTTMHEGVTLACIGYHLVGPSANHPEMIWATFEHKSNSPDLDYYYTNTSDEVVKTSNWNADGTPKMNNALLMSASGQQQATNQMYMEMQGSDIVATPGNTIEASDSCRTHPWGGTPNKTSAKNNTDIISLNQSIQGQLLDGDPRKNYFLVGATWTHNGVPGIGLQEPEIAGSKVLANSTMETYYQFKNCFDCHKGGKINGLSHVFSTIQPLPVPLANE